MACNHKDTSACPFSYTEQSEIVQNYGCLPTPFHIIDMRVEHGKTWACHEDITKPCQGAIDHLKKLGKSYKVIDKELVHEGNEWPEYSGKCYPIPISEIK